MVAEEHDEPPVAEAAEGEEGVGDAAHFERCGVRVWRWPSRGGERHGVAATSVTAAAVVVGNSADSR